MAKGTAPALLLGLQLDQTAGHAPAPAAPSGAAQQLHIEMSSEQLDAMLAGLSKIKDQVWCQPNTSPESEPCVRGPLAPY